MRLVQQQVVLEMTRSHCHCFIILSLMISQSCWHAMHIFQFQSWSMLIYADQSKSWTMNIEWPNYRLAMYFLPSSTDINERLALNMPGHPLSEGSCGSDTPTPQQGLKLNDCPQCVFHLPFNFDVHGLRASWHNKLRSLASPNYVPCSVICSVVFYIFHVPTVYQKITFNITEN